MNIPTIREELKKSMIAKDSERTSVVRMLISAINYVAMAKNIKPEEMTDTDVADVIFKEIKKLNEGIADYEKTGKTENAEKEKSELKILQEFAPKMMNETEARLEIQNILSAADPTIAIGPATGLVMKQLKGKADPAMVSTIISSILKK